MTSKLHIYALRNVLVMKYGTIKLRIRKSKDNENLSNNLNLDCNHIMYCNIIKL